MSATTAFSECIKREMAEGIPYLEALGKCKVEHAPLPEGVNPDNPPTFFLDSTLKDRTIDEILPLLIVLAHKRPEVKAFYDRIMSFCVNIAKAGRSSWVGSWMGFKLMVNVMERFGLIPLGIAASYDTGLSWAFGVTAGTEFLSDIQIGSIAETIIKEGKE